MEDFAVAEALPGAGAPELVSKDFYGSTIWKKVISYRLFFTYSVSISFMYI